MDGIASSSRTPGEQDWQTRTRERLDRIAGPGPEYGLDRLDAALLHAIDDATEALGYPPAADMLFYRIGELLAAADADPGAAALREAFYGFHAINIFTFQSLFCQPRFRDQLADEDLTPARAATAIWRVWRTSKGQTPIAAAALWLDGQHRRLGHGPYLGVEPQTHATVHTIVHPRIAREARELAEGR